MIRNAMIILFSLIVSVITASADTSCVPELELGFISLFSDTPNTLRYSVDMDGTDCGPPNQIGMVVFVDYLHRTDVSDPWTEETIAFHNIFPDELPTSYETPSGDFNISNTINISNMVDDEWSKFKLTVWLFDHEVDPGVNIEYTLGWMDGPNDWQVAPQFQRPADDFTTEQRQDSNVNQKLSK